MSADGPPLAVLWDADGVLQRVPDGAEESMRPAVADRIDDVEAFLAEALVAERPALTGEASWPEVLPGLLARWGIADALDSVLATWLRVEPVAGAREVLARVRAAGTPCYLATNQAAERAAAMRRDLGYDGLVDGGFFSFELGVAKPDPAYFRVIGETLGLPPGDLLFIDDVTANVAAARCVGLRAHTWSYRDGTPALLSLLRGHGLSLGY